MSKRLLLTVGLPRSGKSQWAQQQGHPIVCPDAIRLGLHGKRHEPLAEQFVWAIAKLMVRALFLAGHDTVILDATNVSRRRRAEWRDREWTCEFRVFKTPKDVCEARAHITDQSDMIPVIARMLKDWQDVGTDEGPVEIIACS